MLTQNSLYTLLVIWCRSRWHISFPKYITTGYEPKNTTSFVQLTIYLRFSICNRNTHSCTQHQRQDISWVTYQRDFVYISVNGSFITQPQDLSSITVNESFITQPQDLSAITKFWRFIHSLSSCDTCFSHFDTKIWRDFSAHIYNQSRKPGLSIIYLTIFYTLAYSPNITRVIYF